MSELERIREAFESHDIRRVKIGGFDVDGVLRGKYVSLDKFWSIVEKGMGFCDVIFGWDARDQLYDRDGVTGWHTGYPDTGARIDLETFRTIPWEDETASFLLDFVQNDGTPLAVAPRNVLRSVLSRAESMGFRVTAALEYEFFVYEESPWSMAEKNHTDPRPLSPGMFGYSWLRTSQSSDLVHDLLDKLEEFDVPLEGFHTETGPGVFEAAIRHEDALEAADRAALFKTAVKAICHQHGVMASFMAKPATTLPGCSGHVHQSLWDHQRERNLFHEERSEDGLSSLCRSYLAGQLALMPELAAFVAPTTNSYKRLLGGDWAPSTATWGIDNRTCAVRAIPGHAGSSRLEYRVTGSDINPYVALAAIVAAGLFGIEKQLEAPPPERGNAYAREDAPKLPASLAEATERLRSSGHAKTLLGEAFVEHYLLTRDWEVRQMQKAVTDWERERYFELA